jgi:FkbM family methyltransferase
VYAYQPLLDTGNCEVIGFEPQVAELEKRQREEPRVKLLPYAIGSGNTVTFFECDKPWGSSCLEPNWELMHRFVGLGVSAIVRQLPMQTRQLDHTEEARGTHLLKLDIQGGEYDALEGAGELLRDSVAAIHVEVEFATLLVNQPLFADVDVLLRDLDFDLIDFVHLQRYSYKNAAASLCLPSRLIWGDAVYFKRPARLREKGPEALLRAAYIAHVNYRWYDLAAHILNECGLRDAYEAALCRQTFN